MHGNACAVMWFSASVVKHADAVDKFTESNAHYKEINYSVSARRSCWSDDATSDHLRPAGSAQVPRVTLEVPSKDPRTVNCIDDSRYQLEQWPVIGRRWCFSRP